MPHDVASLACRLCTGEAEYRGRQRLLQHDVAIYQCPRCDLLQTEAPYWLAEAYSQAISALDTGAIQRNQVCAGVVLALAPVLGLTPTARCLDWGGGHGVFVRLMRDRGFDFRWRDEYAENLYARGFEADAEGIYDLVTSFEVFEHFVDVQRELARVFAQKPAFVLAGTRLHAGYREHWWYFANETGQHVAFYSPKTMRVIADEFGYDVIVGPNYTLFARAGQLGRARRGLLRPLLQHAELAYALTSLVPEALRLASKRSLTRADHERLAATRAELQAMNASATTPESAADKPQAAS